MAFGPLDTYTFTMPSAPNSGNLDFGIQGVGPHNIVQGYPLYVVLYNWYISGSSDGLQFQVTGIPPYTQVHWPDEQDLGCNCGVVNTVTTTNDSFNPYYGPGINTQFEIIPNVGGTTPAGNYTLTVTARPGGGASGPTHSFTWAMNVTAASFPSGSPASQPAIPALSLWQSNLTTYGSQWIGTGSAGCTECINFYDGTWVYDQAAAYTGNSSTWIPAANGTNVVYRDDYVIPAGGAVVGLQVFPHGLYNDCKVNANATSCTALHDLAANALGASMIANAAAYEDPISIREGCYMLGAKRLDYDAGGGTTLAAVKQMAAYCLGDEDQIVNGYTGFEQPFMDGLMAQALIEYYLDPQTGNGDLRVPPAI